LQDAFQTLGLRIDFHNARARPASKQRIATYIDGAGKNARRQHTDKPSRIKFRDAGRGADVDFVAGQGNGKHLAIRHATSFVERLHPASLQVDHAAVLCANPEIGFAACHVRDMQTG
jgi:hypothetical protein